MSQSPDGAAFLAAREKFARSFAMTRRGRKEMLAQLAAYDELLFKAYRPHVIADMLNAASVVLRKYEADAPAVPMTQGTESEPLRLNVAQRTALKEMLAAIAALISPAATEPVKADGIKS